MFKALLGVAVGIFLGILLSAKSAHAERVRTLYTNDKIMQTVFLAMGRSTVLRFDEKPKTAIIGNQNYFKIEFLDNDITIQPQGQAATNIFVYSEFQTYGLILKVQGITQYDDLVYVKWRPGYVNVSNRTEKKKSLLDEKPLNARIEIKSLMSLRVTKAIRSVAQGLIIFEIEIKNLSPGTIQSKEVTLNLAVKGNAKPFQTSSIQKDVLATGEITNARLITRLDQIEDGQLSLRYRDQGAKLFFPKITLR